nr:bacteriocin fulvocin C-related protein [Acidobacteriota bacterium]
MKRGWLFVVVLLSLMVSFAMTAQTRERAAGRTPQPVTLIAPPDVVAAYDALSALAPAQRKALYSGLTTEVRAGLWKLQHQMYLADHPELSTEQRAVLNGVIRQLTPQVYLPPSLGGALSADRAELERLHQQAAEIFSPDEMNGIFFQLGGDRGARHNWQLATEAACDCSSNDE